MPILDGSGGEGLQDRRTELLAVFLMQKFEGRDMIDKAMELEQLQKFEKEKEAARYQGVLRDQIQAQSGL